MSGSRLDVLGWIGWGKFTIGPRHSLQLLAAYHLTGNRAFFDAALANIDSQLGNHPLGMTFVTGLAARTPRDPLSDVALSDGVVEPVPGVPVFGSYAHLDNAHPFYVLVQHDTNNFPYTKVRGDSCCGGYVGGVVTIAGVSCVHSIRVTVLQFCDDTSTTSKSCPCRVRATWKWHAPQGVRTHLRLGAFICVRIPNHGASCDGRRAHYFREPGTPSHHQAIRCVGAAGAVWAQIGAAHVTPASTGEGSRE